MQGKVAVEEHFKIDETSGSESRYPGSYWSAIPAKLLDIHGARLAEMDKAGIEIEVISLNSNAVQGIFDTKKAVAVARRANDALAEAVAKRPDRFAALAALPMQDPEAAGAELKRCVRDLKFRGALINGFSQVGSADTAVYYDAPQYRPFWAEVEKLGVPFYLHPRDQLPSRRQAYEGHPWLVGSPWGFADETAIHALRLMGCGLFDEHPKLQIVIGHLGERIPYDLWRLDHRLSKVPNRPAKRSMADYFREQFPHQHQRSLLHAVSGPRASDDRRRPRAVRGRLSVRRSHAGLRLVRRSGNFRRQIELKIGRTNAQKLFALG